MRLSSRLGKLEQQHNAQVDLVNAACERIMIRHRDGIEEYLTAIFGPGVVPLNGETGQAFGFPDLWDQFRGRTLDRDTDEGALQDAITLRRYCEAHGHYKDDADLDAGVDQIMALTRRGLETIAVRVGMIEAFDKWREANSWLWEKSDIAHTIR